MAKPYLAIKLLFRMYKHGDPSFTDEYWEQFHAWKPSGNKEKYSDERTVIAYVRSKVDPDA